MLQLATAPRSVAAPPFDSVEDLAGLTRAYADSQAFVSLLAHELRSRLKVIEWSLHSPDGSSAALESTHSVQELVENLLELARGGEGARGSSDATTAVHRVIDELDAPDVEFVVGELPFVPLPQALLEAVLRNLIVNAVEAGANRIEVYARSNGTICVSDDGPGVPAAKAERIFGLYSSKFGGAGVGLSLVREILRRRGGEIWLERPSTFCFRIR